MNSVAEKPSIYFDSPSLDILKPSELRRDLKSMRMGVQALTSLEGLGVHSIGRLVDAARDGTLRSSGIGPATAVEIENALYALSKSVCRGGRVDWECYLDLRDGNPGNQEVLSPQAHQVSAYAVGFSSPSLDSLSASCRVARIDVLHPSSRAQNFLRATGIENVGDLVASARTGIIPIPPAGMGTVVEVNDMLRALSRSIGNDGSVDWIGYAGERDFIVLPGNHYEKLSPRELLKILPNTLQKAIAPQYGAKGCFVLRQYLLQGRPRSKSIKELADQLACSKQGVALVKKKVLRMLQGAILEDAYSGCRFRLRPAFVAPFRQLRAALHIPKDRPLLYSEWQKFVLKCWGLTPAEFARIEHFLLSILDYRVFFPGGREFQPYILPNNRNSSTFTAALNATDRLLRLHFPNGLSEEQLLAKLNASVAPDLTKRGLLTLLSAVPGVEHVRSKKKVRMRLENVTRLSAQLERLLRDRGSPMHIRELTVKIREVTLDPTRQRTSGHISSSLTGNKERFKPIGRTGYWVLTEWTNIETRTVAELSAAILRSSKRPMTEGELYRLVVAKRPVAPNSVGRMLSESGKFRRTAPRTWELK